ncbi:hypothetical protein BLNAU_22908 [Blattamonas nauphoetae]|uniref:Uncharacterized protein n=1 Tax=Blattamonas nauphoetae TaxID=2049346 RepID=A0ABQ9WRS5_9EUKA|nr:hypothetical protein BLNAU_22908 [Blattamonas nauphoetae]
MNEELVAFNSSNDADPNHSRDSHSAVNTLSNHFPTFDVNSKLSFEDQSTIFCSLVALVKAEHPFDKALQDKAVQFLKSLEPKWNEDELATKLVTDLVPSSAGSPSGFVESILTLLSSPHSTVVVTALSFLHKTAEDSSTEIRCRLVESDLVSKVLAAVQPHTLPISGNETMFYNLITIILDCITITSPLSLQQLGKIAKDDAFNHREMILQKVVLPSPVQSTCIKGYSSISISLADVVSLIRKTMTSSTRHPACRGDLLSRREQNTYSSAIRADQTVPEVMAIHEDQ